MRLKGAPPDGVPALSYLNNPTGSVVGFATGPQGQTGPQGLRGDKGDQGDLVWYFDGGSASSVYGGTPTFDGGSASSAYSGSQIINGGAALDG